MSTPTPIIYQTFVIAVGANTGKLITGTYRIAAISLNSALAELKILNGNIAVDVNSVENLGVITIAPSTLTG
jgi:hypothetical protein